MMTEILQVYAAPPGPMRVTAEVQVQIVCDVTIQN
jgi:hypothetical protein